LGQGNLYNYDYSTKRNSEKKKLLTSPLTFHELPWLFFHLSSFSICAHPSENTEVCYDQKETATHLAYDIPSNLLNKNRRKFTRLPSITRFLQNKQQLN
jgi:hypothetical protein